VVAVKVITALDVEDIEADIILTDNHHTILVQTLDIPPLGFYINMPVG